MFNKIISSPIVKVPARYGAIAGVLCVIFLITLFYMGKSPFLINPYMDFRVILFAILIFFALKEERDFYKGGFLEMWEGMASGLVFLVIAAIIGAIGILIFGAIQPAFFSNFIAEATAQIQNYPDETVKQIGKDVLERSLSELRGYTTSDLASRYTGQTFIIGFFITIIISVILRRQPKQN